MLEMMYIALNLDFICVIKLVLFPPNRFMSFTIAIELGVFCPVCVVCRQQFLQMTSPPKPHSQFQNSFTQMFLLCPFTTVYRRYVAYLCKNAFLETYLF